MMTLSPAAGTFLFGQVAGSDQFVAFTAGVPNEPQDYYPSYVTLTQVQAGADPIVMPVPSKSSAARFDFLGWTKPKRSPNTGTPTWAVRGLVALQCSHHLQESEMAVGVFRFTRIADESTRWDDDWTKGLNGKVSSIDRSRHPVTPTGLRLARLCPADHTLAELFCTEYAAGVLLDGHIHAPNAVKAAIMRSWQRTVDIFLAEARAEMESAGLTPSDDEVEINAHALVHAGGGEVQAYAIHRGAYHHLGTAHAALNEWLAANDHDAAGPHRERYLLGPGEADSPDDFVTEVSVPVAPS